MIKNKSVGAHAAVIIWNYLERGDSKELSLPHKIEKTYFITKEVVSVKTQKQKGNPVGSFQIELSSNKNWTNKITPGSWCAIMMSNSADSINSQSANELSLKMVGRITSCRLSVTSDDRSGARVTRHIIDGKDWGCVFESILYIDPVFRGNSLLPASTIGQAATLIAKHKGTWITDNGLPRVGQVIDAMKRLWGQEDTIITSLNQSLQSAFKKSDTLNIDASPLQLISDASFLLPTEVYSFLTGNVTLTSSTVNFATIIEDVEGVLADYDEYDYSEKVKDGVGLPNLSFLFGMNDFWSVIVNNSNVALNEVFCDLRWTNSVPNFALFRRIRPFCNRSDFEGSDDVKDLISQFKLVKKHLIPINDVISINAGTNWKNRVNFIEMRATPNYMGDLLANDIKIDSQTFDKNSIKRDGFRPLPIQNTTVSYLPFPVNDKVKKNNAIIKQFTGWKYLVREWHFNTHTQLNGTVVLVGQDSYIGVGDNIMISMKIFGDGHFNETFENSESYLLAHVESISHRVEINEYGTRMFLTDIQFVRGVVTDSEGNSADGTAALPLGIDYFASDLDSKNSGTGNQILSSTSPIIPKP